MGLQFTLQKKHIYVFLAFTLLVLGAVFVQSFGSGDPNLHGHDSGELDISLSKLQTVVSSDFHNLGGSDANTQCDDQTCGSMTLSSGSTITYELNDQDVIVGNGRIQIGSGNSNGVLEFFTDQASGDTRTSTIEFDHFGQQGSIAFTDSAGSPGTSTMTLDNQGGDIILRSNPGNGVVIDSGGTLDILEFGTANAVQLTRDNNNRLYITREGAVGSEEVGIGTTSPTNNLEVVSSSDGTVLLLTDSDGSCAHNPESGTETVTCSSDERLKENIRDAAPVLEDLMKFEIRDFTVKASGDEKTGLIAQEVLEVFPDMVHMGDDGYYMVEQVNTWKLVKAIQELKAQNDELKALVCLDHPEAEACQ